MRQFPLTSGAAGGSQWRQTINMPPPSGGGTGAALKMVQLYCVQQIPSADYTVRVFEIIGATPDDEIEWSFSGSAFDYIVGGDDGSHFPVMLLAVSGDGGTVSATFNGESLGTLAYASNADSTCLNLGAT